MMTNILDRVIDCVALTTRYPKQLLTPNADLENDLGIDSVKRVEIVAALADEFELDLISQERDPSIRTIEDVARWIEAALSANGSTAGVGEAKAPTANGNRVPSPVVAPAPPAPPTLQNGNGGQGIVNGGVSHISPSHGLPQPNMPVSRRLEMGNPYRGALQGRVALVTGSGRGVGKTIARLLASRGATVVINSFHSRDQGEQTAAEINATGGSAIHLWGSVANPEQVAALFAELDQRVGYLDMLICNASDGRIGSFQDVTPEDWDRAFRTNVAGHHQCAMLASRLMERRGGGSIVTMSSIAAHRYVEGMGGQGVIKAAVESMTRYLACALAPLGIRTNCVSGGPVYGDLMDQYPEARATHNYWERIIPDGQMCSPMDLASTIAFLLGDEARAINGAIWTVDHGASTRAHSRPLPQSMSGGLTPSSS
jgi:acyl carrier protein